jgi:alpha-tubulin suppressor-like RCC1 family protein
VASSEDLVEVKLPSVAVDVDAGAGLACALLADGTVWCWGRNSGGQLGRGLESDLESTPMPVLFSGRAIGMGVANSTACLWTDDGMVACWGVNSLWHLAPESTDTSAPTVLPELAGATSVAVSSGEVCAIVLGRVVCRDVDVDRQGVAVERTFPDP